ncbi:single-strand DNA-binding protein [Paraglaciecola Antarctic JLT virus 2]|nr:single-strand DNA-binding protein [Paraglaciecola Antarctic JLT virus 2]
MGNRTMLIRKASSTEDGKNLWGAIVTFLKATDNPIKITIEEATDNRKLAQNKLNFMWCNEVAKHVFASQGLICSSEDIHELIARKLLPLRVVSINGETIIYRSETKTLSVKKFSEYLQRFEFYALEQLGAKLTHPEDLYFNALMKQEG